MILNHVIKKSSNIDIGLTYLFKAYPRYMSTGLFNSLCIYDRTLELLNILTLAKQKTSKKNILKLIIFLLLFNTSKMDVNIANIEDFKDKIHNNSITYDYFGYAKYIDVFSIAYWSTVIREKWALTEYDISLFQEGLITKHAAHALLLSDVKLLEEHTVPRVAKCDRRVAAQLRDCKLDGLNSSF